MMRTKYIPGTSLTMLPNNYKMTYNNLMEEIIQNNTTTVLINII